MKLQNEFQKRIVELVEITPIENAPKSAIKTDDARNRFLVDGREKVVLVVDMPPERKGSTVPLEFVIEEDRRRVKSDDELLKVITPEPSTIWKALQTNFQKAIGKVRVFCHPEHADFLSAYLSRSEIENALSDALNLIERE